MANRIAAEGIWMTNIAYMSGYDGITFDTTNRQFVPVNRAGAYLKKNRMHVNKILPTINNRLAKLCKNPPKYDVQPESSSVEDKDAARLSLQILKYIWCKEHIDEKRIPLYMWTQQCGHGYMKVCWDPTLGKRQVNPEIGELEYEGDIRIDVVSPFEIFVDAQAKNWDDVCKSWLIQAKVRKLDYFKMHYPDKGDLVKEEDAWLLSLQYDYRINSLNARGPASSGLGMAMKDSAIELTKYEAPSKKYPNGRMITVANGIVLVDKELPCGEIPFCKFDDILVAGKYYSEAIITSLRPIQDQYNETIRRRAEWTKKLLSGKLIAARGSAIAQESLNDQSGELVYYTPVPNAPNGGAPVPMTMPMIPEYAYKEEERLTQMMNDISGISEVSRGTLPSAGIPALGMQILTEADDSRIGVITEQHEGAFARLGKLILSYVQDYYVMPRKLKIAGTSLEYTVKDFVGADIRNNTDVVVIRGSTLPGNKALRRQEILNLFNQGLLGNPQDPKVLEKVLGMLEFGDIGEAWEDYGIDQAQIKRGISALEQGLPVMVHEFDNHEAWITELNRFRKQEKFEKLPPQIQMLFDDCAEQHLQFFIQQNQPPQPLSGPGEMPPAPEGLGMEQPPTEGPI